MNLMELRKKPHLSASSINTYTDCGLLYKLSKIDKYKPDFTADALVFGTAIHKALADYHEARVFGELMSSEEIQDRFVTTWAESAEDNKRIKYKKGKTFKGLLNEGKRLLSTYVEKQTNDDFCVLAIEEPFSLTIEGLDVPIIGAMDLVEEDSDGTIIITDHKTAARAFSVAEVDKNFQLSVYYLAARHNGYADREIVLKFDCLIKTKIPKFEPFYTFRNEDDEKRTIRKIMSVWDGIKKGTFVPNDTSWRCSGCSYKSHCNNWFKGEESCQSS